MNDGIEDLILANGHPDPLADAHEVGVHYREPLLLFHNNGHGFDNVSALAGEAFGMNWAARGLAVGDFDNDGALDVLISNSGGAPLLLRNLVGGKNNWLGVRLIGKHGNIDAVGARVTWAFGGQQRTQMKTGGGSFLSSHGPSHGVGNRTSASSGLGAGSMAAAIGSRGTVYRLAGSHLYYAPGRDGANSEMMNNESHSQS